MKINTVLCTLLLAALSLGACDKSDKKTEAKNEAKTEETAKAGETGAAAGTAADPATTGTAAGTTGTATTDPAAGAGATATGTTPAASAGTLEILSEGTGNKYVLKYQPSAGLKQGMEMSMDMAMDTPMGKMTIPTMIMKADVEVVSVDPKGNITTKMTFQDIDVKETKDSMPGIADAMKQQMASMKGMTATMTIEPSGKVVSSEFGAPSDPMLAQQIGQTQQSLNQMVAQLPDKPIGKGGKWQVKQQMDQNGMKIDQTSVFEVVAISEKTAKIKTVATLSAPKQTMNQGGVQAELEKLDGKGTIDLDLDFTKVVPSVQSKMDMSMTVNAMGQPMDMKTALTMKIRATK